MKFIEKHMTGMSEKGSAYSILIPKAETKRRSGEIRRSWDDNIEMYLEDIWTWGRLSL
jgi:hypothetical protein